MAVVAKGGTLPDTGVTKNEIYALVDSATVSSIVNADIDSSAAIADSKLATISTAGKVSGAALTSLASIPAGAGVIPSANAPTPAGCSVQVVNKLVTTHVTTTTEACPWDDTIPQASECKDMFSQAFTPTSATNTLKIDVVFNFSADGGAQAIVGLWKGTEADALAASAVANTINDTPMNCTFTYYMTAGTTSEITFKVKAATNTSTMTMNGASGGRLLGGVYTSSITITEIKV